MLNASCHVQVSMQKSERRRVERLSTPPPNPGDCRLRGTQSLQCRLRGTQSLRCKKVVLWWGTKVLAADVRESDRGLRCHKQRFRATGRRTVATV